MNLQRCIAISLLLLVGCAKDENVPVTETQTPLTPPIQFYEGTMSFSLNGTQHAIGVFAQTNGYVPGEVVLRGSGEGMENTLMLTFKPTIGRVQSINQSMTGYWDLGLCIPFNKYVLRSDTLNSIVVMSNDTTLAGQFNLVFRYEKDTSKTAIFLHGAFAVKVDTVYPFKYCIEG
jgi:hypothetical protein